MHLNQINNEEEQEEPELYGNLLIKASLLIQSYSTLLINMRTNTFECGRINAKIFKISNFPVIEGDK